VDPDFEGLRREHRQILDALDRLEGCIRAGLQPEAFAGAVGAFLEFYGIAIEAHMQREEAEVYPLLERYVPADVGSASAMLLEHETVHSLVRLLRQAAQRPGCDAAVRTEAFTLAQDLVLLLRDHIRKEDGVINPLLERIGKGAHA
jgi:hemerythrin-like domain-containing protein